jgi:hypothetical protein
VDLNIEPGSRRLGSKRHLSTERTFEVVDDEVGTRELLPVSR